MPTELLLSLLLATQATLAPQAAPSAAKEDLEAEVRKAMMDVLKDPLSAQYMDLRRAKTPGYLCGKVNSKNSYGGYTGFRSFVVTPKNGVQIAREDPIVGPHAAQFIALVCGSDGL